MSEILSTIRIAVSVIVTAALALLGIILAGNASKAEIEHMNNVALAQQTLEMREWSKYIGVLKGSDVIDFILTHKHTCDIVISGSSKLSNYQFLMPYAIKGTSIILSDKYNYIYWGSSVDPEVIENIYSLSYLYNYIINPSATFEGILLYDNQLSADNSVEHTAVTGIIFTETQGG